MTRNKPKADLDNELDEALEETFPGSDAIAVDKTHDRPIRPIDRRPPAIDKHLVDKLAKKNKSERDKS